MSPPESLGSGPPEPPSVADRPDVSSDDAFEPELPRYIPEARAITPVWARPVLTDSPWGPVAGQLNSSSPLDPGLRTWWAALELVLLIPAGVLGGLCGYLLARWFGVHEDRWQLVAATVGMGSAVVVTAVLFVLIDGQRAASIGWTLEQFIPNVIFGAAALLVTYLFAVGLFVAFTAFYPEILDQESAAHQAIRERIPPMSTSHMAVLMTFVAVWEELVFRGFVLTRFKSLVRRWWLAVPLSSLVFGTVHLYEGSFAVVLVTILGFVMALLFLWRRSLVPCITMHFLNNFTMFLVMRSEIWGLVRPLR